MENISGTVDKAIDILEIFLQKEGGLRLTELADLTGFNRASVYRVASTLVKRRFLRQTKKNGKHSLGLKMIDCSFAIRRNLKFIDMAYLYLGKLNLAHRAAVNLTILDEDKSLVVEEIGISSRGLPVTSSEIKRLPLYAFMKKNIPTFENSFILDTASQTGTRGSRRLIGEYIISKEDLQNGKQHDDTIAVIPRMGPQTGGHSFVYFPYRALVPVKVEGLLVAGRSFSSDDFANNMVNLIPHCIAMGQAAGTAAAISVKQGISPRKVDYGTLQSTLMKQGVLLPGVKVAFKA
jgi:hypothetical protein